VTALRELTLDRFTEALASSAATPGGGSASALSGALAASLLAMVARNTAANASFTDNAAALEGVASEADRLRAELVGLVDEDAAAFERVMAAFRLPKDTPDLKEARSREIQAGYKAAVEPPLLVCRSALDVLALAGGAAELGNPNAISDVGVAALLAASALEGAALNVEINLGSIKDETFRDASASTVERARSDAEKMREETLAAVRARLR
jgi:formiminotetrahydrofolate cyclodeaminase